MTRERFPESPRGVAMLQFHLSPCRVGSRPRRSPPPRIIPPIAPKYSVPAVQHAATLAREQGQAWHDMLSVVDKIIPIASISKTKTDVWRKKGSEETTEFTMIDRQRATSCCTRCRISLPSPHKDILQEAVPHHSRAGDSASSFHGATRQNLGCI